MRQRNLKLKRRFGGTSILGRDLTTGQSHMPGGTKMMILVLHIIVCLPTQRSPGTNLGMNGSATPTTEAARAATQLNLFSGYGAAALHP